MSDTTDILTGLIRVLGRLFDQLVDSVTDPDERAAMLTQLGLSVPDGAPPDPAAARQAVDDLQQKASTDAEDNAHLMELLDFALSRGLALHALFEDVAAANDGTVVATIVASYLELMCATTLRLRQPTGYAIFQALRFVDDQEIYFERLPALLTSADEIMDGGPTVDEQQEIDAWSLLLGALGFLWFFIPEPAEADSILTRKALYGIDLDPGATHPNADEILNRMVSFAMGVETPPGADGVNAGGEWIQTAVLVPPHHGGPGIFWSAGGDAKLVVPIGKQLELKLTVQALGAMSVFSGFDAVEDDFAEGPTSGSAVPPDAGIEVALERPDKAVQSEKPARIGAKDSFHLETRSFKADVKLGTRTSGASVGFEKAALVIPQHSFGSLLAFIMPSGGVRLEATFTAGWSTDREWYLDGGAGLKTTLPVDFTAIPGIALHTVTIELTAKTDEPAGIDLLVYGSFTIGVRPAFTVNIDRIGVAFETSYPKDHSGPLMGQHGGLRGLAPTGIGISVDWRGLTGGGFLLFDPDRGEYGGALALQFVAGKWSLVIRAFGLLTERPNGWSFVVVLSVAFDPPLQLGAIAVHEVGGIVAINHTIDVEAMRAGLRDGALDRILFPADLTGSAATILQTLRTVFPVSDQRTLVGPTVKLGVGSPLEFLTASVALVVVIPSPVLIALLGSLRVAVPHPDKALVDLRADFFGVYDLGTGAVSIDASLVKSRIGWYPVQGDFAFRSGHDWFFAAGGFHPHFPAPADAPQLRRLRLDVSSSPLVRLRFEIYAALTSNTLQFGGTGELTIGVGSFGVYGFVGLDVLIHTRSPVKFSAHVSVTLELRFHGSVLASLRADILVEGPGPWHVKGHVSMSILFWDISVPFDETWAEFEAAVAAADIDVLAEVKESITEQAAWASVLPASTEALVVLRTGPRTALTVHPLGRLAISQAIVPLGVAVTRVGAARPAGGATAVYVGPVSLTTGLQPEQAPVTGQFARAQYFDLTDDEALSAPSYEALPSGIELASPAIHAGVSRRTDVEYETILVGADVPRRPAGLDLAHLHWALSSGAVGRSGLHDPGVNAGPDQSVRFSPPESVVVDTATMQPAADVLGAAATLSVAEQALAAIALTDPARARRLQVVGTHEVPA
jgi:hypothetical protein